jgi:type II secretory pathway component PulJ
MMEMMFALLILSIVILGLVSVLGAVLRNQSEGRAYDQVSIATNAIFADAGLALSEDFEKSLIPDTFRPGRQPMESLKEVSFEVSETRERDDLKRVDIVVYWKDKNGIEHRKAMSTKFLKER